MLQRRGAELASPAYPPYGVAFDVDKLLWELEFFTKHYVEGYRGAVIAPADREALRGEWRRLAEELAERAARAVPSRLSQPQPDAAQGELYIIDFQDARLGPDTYDLVSLLRDSYVDLPETTVDELMAYFVALKRPQGGDAIAHRAWEHDFRRRFDVMALQRNLKALGTFGYQTSVAPQSGVHPVHPPHDPARADEPAAQRRAALAGCASCSAGLHGRTRAESAQFPTARGLEGPEGCLKARWPTLEVWADGQRSMQFGVSTHLYHDARLDRDHLVEIAAHGFEAVEIFATRTHVDYHDAQTLTVLAEPHARQPGCARTRCTRRSPRACTSGVWGPAYSLATTDESARQRAVDETLAALRAAAALEAGFLVLHLGVPLAQQPDGRDNRRDAVLKSLETLHAGGRPARRPAGARGDPEPDLRRRRAGRR